MCGLAIAFFAVNACLVLTIDIVGKWVIIGKRKPGRYNWDTSSYNQRWELHKQLQGLRSGASLVAWAETSQAEYLD
jgi:hypothetical protein